MVEKGEQKGERVGGMIQQMQDENEYENEVSSCVLCFGCWEQLNLNAVQWHLKCLAGFSPSSLSAPPLPLLIHVTTALQ